MDFAQLQWRARRLAGVEVTDAAHDPTDVAEAVNDAHAELCGLERWAFLYLSATVPTVAGTSVYTLPAPLRKVAAVHLDGVRLVPRAPHAAPHQGLRVGEYELHGGLDVHVSPEPHAAGELAVHGWREPSVLAAAADEPLLPPEYHRTVAYLAAVGLLTQAPETEKLDARVDAYTALVGADLERLRSVELPQHDTTIGVIGARRFRRGA